MVPNLPVGTACLQIKMVARTTDASSSTGIYWPDRVLTLLLVAFREKESIWNTKSEEYENRNLKKRHNTIIAAHSTFLLFVSSIFLGMTTQPGLVSAYNCCPMSLLAHCLPVGIFKPIMFS